MICCCKPNLSVALFGISKLIFSKPGKEAVKTGEWWMVSSEWEEVAITEELSSPPLSEAPMVTSLLNLFFFTEVVNKWENCSMASLSFFFFIFLPPALQTSTGVCLHWNRSVRISGKLQQAFIYSFVKGFCWFVRVIRIANSDEVEKHPLVSNFTDTGRPQCFHFEPKRKRLSSKNNKMVFSKPVTGQTALFILFHPR